MTDKGGLKYKAIIAVLLALFAGLAASSCRRQKDPKIHHALPPRPQYPVSIQMPESEQKELAEKWGIQIMSLRLTSAGYMLDFRYKVLDPEKASPILSRQVKPYLIDEATGQKTIVPSPSTVGSLRETSMKPKAGTIYYMFFANPGQTLKEGDKATIVIGDFKAEHLIVEK